MNRNHPLWRQLEVDLADASGIIVPKGREEGAYFEEIRESVRANAADPELITATV